MLLWAGSLTKHKHIEIEAIDNQWSWFKIKIDWSRKTDHAGLLIEGVLFMKEISFRLYDSRHWDYKNDRWNIPTQKGE